MEETEKIKALVVFSQEGTLSKTAEKLNISQPSLTRTMKDLERSLGVSLFDRNHNSISLNETGLYAVEKFKMLLTNIDNLKEDIIDYNSLNKSLIIESQHTYLPEIKQFLEKIGKTFSKQYIYKKKSSEEIIQDLNQGIVDIAFLTFPVKIEGYKCSTFIYDNLSVCVPPQHALTKKVAVYIEDLKQYSFISEIYTSYWQEIVAKEAGDLFFVKVENTKELEVLMQQSSLPAIGTQKCCAQCEYRKYRNSILLQDEKAKIIMYVIYKPGNKNLDDILKGFDY